RRHRRRELGEDRLARNGAGADQEAMRIEQLGEGEVEAVARRRAASDRGTEAQGGRVAAVDPDDERVAAADGVVAVPVLAAGEDAALDRDRRELTRPDADERGRRRLLRPVVDGQRPVLTPCLPEPEARR